MNLECSNGSFYIRKDTMTIFVQGTVNGKKYKRSTKKKVSSEAMAKAWIKKNNHKAMDTLLDILGIDKDSDSKTVSFEDFGYRYLNATRGKRNKHTQEDYLRIFRISIVPYFNNFSWSDFDSLSLSEFYNQIREQYSYDRSKRTKNIINNILETAYDEELLKRNIVRMKTIRDHSYEPDAPNTEAYEVSEVRKMLEESEGWMKVFMELALKYGLRVGELMGLKWSDFDLERGFFKINRNITKGEIVESVNIKTNKNHLREIFMFPETIHLLKSFKNFRMSDEWIFVSKDGKPFLNSKTITDYHFKPTLEKIGVPYRTVHAMRRSYISIMTQSEQIDKKEIQKVVGHAEGSRITDKHYNLDCLNDTHKQNKAKEHGKVFNALLAIA